MSTANILLVKEGPLVRARATDIAEVAGLALAATGIASSAWAILQNNIQTRLRFSDVRMSGTMHGRDVARPVFDRGPPERLILISGSSPARRGTSMRRLKVITKPYRPDALEILLHQHAALAG